VVFKNQPFLRTNRFWVYLSKPLELQDKGRPGGRGGQSTRGEAGGWDSGMQYSAAVDGKPLMLQGGSNHEVGADDHSNLSAGPLGPACQSCRRLKRRCDRESPCGNCKRMTARGDPSVLCVLVVGGDMSPAEMAGEEATRVANEATKQPCLQCRKRKKRCIHVGPPSNDVNLRGAPAGKLAWCGLKPDAAEHTLAVREKSCGALAPADRADAQPSSAASVATAFDAAGQTHRVRLMTSYPGALDRKDTRGSVASDPGVRRDVAACGSIRLDAADQTQRVRPKPDYYGTLASAGRKDVESGSASSKAGTSRIVSCVECRRRKQRCLCGPNGVAAPQPRPPPTAGSPAKEACSLCRQRKKRCVHVLLPAFTSRQGLAANGVPALSNKKRERDRERERSRSHQRMQVAAAAVSVSPNTKEEEEGAASMPLSSASAATPSTTVAPVRKRDRERERNRRRMRDAAAAAVKAEAGGSAGISTGGVAAATTPPPTVAPKRKRDGERERNRNRQRLRVAAAAASVSAHMKAEGTAGKMVIPIGPDNKHSMPLEYSAPRCAVSCAECRRRKQRCLCGQKVVVASGPGPDSSDLNLAPRGMGGRYSATMVKAACSFCRQRKKRCVHVFLGAGPHQTRGIVASGGLTAKTTIRKRDRERERSRNRQRLREAAAAKVEAKAEAEDAAGMPMDAAAAAVAISSTVALMPKRDRDRNRKRDRERERNRNRQRMRVAAREAAKSEAECAASMPMGAAAVASVSEHAKAELHIAAGSISMPMVGAAAAPSPTVGPVRKRDRERNRERDRKRRREGGDAMPPLVGGSTRFTPCDFCRRRRIRCVHFGAAAGAGIAGAGSGLGQQGIVKSNEATRASKRLPEQVAAVAHAHLSPQKKPRLAGGGREDNEESKHGHVSGSSVSASYIYAARYVPCDDCRRRKRKCRCTINMPEGAQESAASGTARSSSGGKRRGLGSGVESDHRGATGAGVDSGKEREEVNWLLEFAQLAQVRRAGESACSHYCGGSVLS